MSNFASCPVLAHSHSCHRPCQELKDISTSGVLICWNVNDILLRKGEDADTWPHTATLTAATLAQSLEISVGGHGSWCLVAKNQKERDRFVCAIQILQLYHSLQNQLATNFSTPKKSEMEGYGEGGLLGRSTICDQTVKHSQTTGVQNSFRTFSERFCTSYVAKVSWH